MNEAWSLQMGCVLKTYDSGPASPQRDVIKSEVASSQAAEATQPSPQSQSCDMGKHVLDRRRR